MISSADYADWLDQSGLYVRNYSDAERYQTFEKRISPEGLNVRIVFDFLHQNRDGVDVQAWRNYHVYENDGGLRYRIERTAEALAAVGASGASEAVRTSENTSLLGQLTSGFLGSGNRLNPPGSVDLSTLMQEFQRSAAAALGGGDDFVLDEETQELVPRRRRRSSVESRDEIAGLLRNYVEHHAATLQADIDRHGDVRQQPGFHPQLRQEALNANLLREHDRERQLETVAKMRSQMEQFEKGIAKYGEAAPRKLRSTRRKLFDGRREFANRPEEELLPEMRAWLDEFESFANRHAGILFPPPVQNADLLARLRDLGEYEYDVQEFGTQLSWKAPRGFDSDWTLFSLTILYPEANEEALTEALDAVEELRSDFAHTATRLRAEVLQGFRDHAECMGGLERLAEWMEFARDDAGGVPESEILRMAGHATINVESLRLYSAPGARIVVWFPAEWDEEHGLEVRLAGGEGFDDGDNV